MRRRSLRNSSGRKVFLFLPLFLPAILMFVFYHALSGYFLPKERTTILFLTDPVEVVSFDPAKKQWTSVKFPARTHVAGIQGFGDYAVDALWNLAATEGNPSSVVLGSVGDELGVPIEYYVGRAGEIWGKHIHFFTIHGLWERLLQRQKTNIPILLYLALTKSFRSTERHKIQTVVLEAGRGLKEQRLPDNSTSIEFDRTQFDSITADIFVDSQIRDERIRIAVFNTTGRPFLGSRVARILDRLGAMVVQVGNEESAVEDCQISGTPRNLATKTSLTIQQLFNCIPNISSDEGRADLEVFIGKAYERRFIPRPLLQSD